MYPLPRSTFIFFLSLRLEYQTRLNISIIRAFLFQVPPTRLAFDFKRIASECLQEVLDVCENLKNH